MCKNTVSLIEKRFQIDGKPGYYLNEQYIKGEPKLTDKQKMSIVIKSLKKSIVNIMFLKVILQLWSKKK